MKILIACEESQAVCIAFRKRGFEAYSCDLVECSGGHPEWHIQDNVLKHLGDGWDMMIAHPPCTYLSSSGLPRNKDPQRVFKTIEAAKFFMDLWTAPIKIKCIENPAGAMSTIFRAPDQYVHPYYFGERQMKRTGLWLDNLPPLIHHRDDNLFGRKTHSEKPEPIYIDYTGEKRYFTDAQTGGDGGRIRRSKTFQSIAEAMASQWGDYLTKQFMP